MGVRMNREQYLKGLIKGKGYNLKEFAGIIDIPYTTLLSMLNGSIGGAAVDNVIKICKNLGIPVETLGNSVKEPEAPNNSAQQRGNFVSMSDTKEVADLFDIINKDSILAKYGDLNEENKSVIQKNIEYLLYEQNKVNKEV